MKVANIKTRIYLGVFLLTLALIGGLCLVLAGDSISMFRTSRSYKARFDNAGGLVVGAPVRMGGLAVGRVADLTIDSKGEKVTVVAKLQVDAPFFELIRSDATVGLDTQGLLGDKFVALRAGMAEGAIDENATIATREAGGMGQALENSGAILSSVKSTVDKLDAFASGLPEHQLMKGMVQDFAGSAAALRSIITRLSADESFVTILSDPEAKAILQRSLAQLESTLTHTASIAEKIDKGQGSLGALVNDRGLYEDMRELLGHRDRGKGARRVFIEAANSEEKELVPAPTR